MANQIASASGFKRDFIFLVFTKHQFGQDRTVGADLLFGLLGQNVVEIVPQNRRIDRFIFKKAGNHACSKCLIKAVCRLCRGFAQCRENLHDGAVNQALFFAQVPDNLDAAEKKADQQGKGNRDPCLFDREAIPPFKPLLIKAFVRHA